MSQDMQLNVDSIEIYSKRIAKTLRNAFPQATDKEILAALPTMVLAATIAEAQASLGDDIGRPLWHLAEWVEKIAEK